MSVYLGIDWSQSKHDATFVNRAGASLAQLTISHAPSGFLTLGHARAQLGVEASDCVVGLETAHTMLVDFLWDRGYERISVVPPNVVKSNRSRYRQSGARSDPSDALVLADVLRTDRGRLHPWFPDSSLTRQIRAKISLIIHPTRTIGALSNRLRAVLCRYHPAALEVFRKLTSNISLAFIQACPMPEVARELSWDEFQAFGRAHRYPNSRNLAAAFARLQAVHPEASPETIQVYQAVAPLLARLLMEKMLKEKKAALSELTEFFS
jgi:transposase